MRLNLKRLCLFSAILILFFSLIVAAESFSQRQVVAAAEIDESGSSESPLEKASELSGERPVIKVGMEANYAPFNKSQVDDSNGALPIANSPGEFANGYDLQIAKLIADYCECDLEIIKIEWDGLPPALLSGKIDAIIAGMSPTAERKEIIDFTDLYYSSDLVLVMRKDSRYINAESLNDLAGAKITAQLNTSHYTVIDQIKDVDKVAAMDSFPTMITAVSAGTIDAYVSERPGAMAAVAANRDLDFVAFEPGRGFNIDIEEISLAIGLRKGSELKTLFNQALSSIDLEKRDQIMREMIALDLPKEVNEEAADDKDADLESVSAVENEEGFWSSLIELFQEFSPLFLRGTGVTALISIVGTILGFIIGLIVQLLRMIPLENNASFAKKAANKLLCFILNAYIEIFRGTPMMVQSILIFYGSRLFFNFDIAAMPAAFLIVSINTGAYLAEVIRGGIDSVEKEQIEACKAIGLTYRQSMFNVILPQSIKAILPAIANEFVVNIKDTSVLNVISVTELFFVTRSVAGSSFKIFQTYAITAIIYFILTFGCTRLINYLGAESGRLEPFSLSSSTTEAAVAR